jgi:acyl-CoA synthetase (AMP-forming)/AMP-acid ligase II
VVDKEGGIRLSGRIKDEVNRAGFKIQPSEIDLVLEGHPWIAEACCFGIPDPVAGETLAAAVRMVDNATETAQSLREWCATRIRREATPERWFFVAEIPRTARGKVSRDAVRRALTENREQ